MILVTTLLASLPGLAIGMLASKMTLRSRGIRGPLDVRRHPQVEAATAQGWRMTR